MSEHQSEFERIIEAYIAMARKANYRPSASGDGFGSVDLTEQQLASERTLRDEAQRYARRFLGEEDERIFHIGCTNWETNRAAVWTIEAARTLCGAADHVALRLLRLAVADVERAIAEREKAA